MQFVRQPAIVGCVSAVLVLITTGLWVRGSSPGWTRPQDVFPSDDAAPVAERVCTIDLEDVTEASGIAVSRRVPDGIWIHNDSGDAARLFLLGSDGQRRATVRVAGQEPFDWEDICSFERDGRPWLLIADVGDNGHVRGASQPECRLILIREPELTEQRLRSSPELTVQADAVIRIRYPGGPVNCESVAVDPVAGEILLVTKTDPFSCRLFRLPLSLTSPSAPVTVEPLASPAVPFATGMDVSPDGRQLAIVTMTNAAIVRRQPDESWSAAMQKPATVLELPAQPQCEAVCFSADARSILVTSEFRNQPLWKIVVPPVAEAP